MARRPGKRHFFVELSLLGYYDYSVTLLSYLKDILFVVFFEFFCQLNDSFVILRIIRFLVFFLFNF